MKLNEVKPIEIVEYIVVEISKDNSILISKLVINEGRWVDSGSKGWMMRVDPEDPNIPLQRHVHIAKNKHINSKDMQASWNEDGTRHDKSSFNQKTADIKAVKQIARTALGLESGIVLEEVKNEREILIESSNNITSSAPCHAYFLKIE